MGTRFEEDLSLVQAFNAVHVKGFLYTGLFESLLCDTVEILDASSSVLLACTRTQLPCKTWTAHCGSPLKRFCAFPPLPKTRVGDTASFLWILFSRSKLQKVKQYRVSCVPINHGTRVLSLNNHLNHSITAVNTCRKRSIPNLVSMMVNGVLVYFSMERAIARRCVHHFQKYF